MPVFAAVRFALAVACAHFAPYATSAVAAAVQSTAPNRADAAAAPGTAAGTARPDAQTSAARREVFYAGLRSITGPYEAIRGLRETDPARYVTETDAYIGRLAGFLQANADAPQASSYARDLAKTTQRLGSFARFTLHDAPRAVALYRRAIAMRAKLEPAQEKMALDEHAALADTLRFDLRDTAGALAEYRALLASVAAFKPPDDSPDATIMRAVTQWCRAEIAFLATDQRFSRTPGMEAVVASALAIDFGAHGMAGEDAPLAVVDKVLIARLPRDDERAAFAAQLEALSTSQTRVLATFNYLPLLGTPDRIARYLRKHDPTGFVTRSMFAGWQYLEREGPSGNHVGMDVRTWSGADRALMRKAEAATLQR